MQFVIVDPVISGVPHLLDIGDAQRLERVLHPPQCRRILFLPDLIHAGDNAEARQTLDAVGKVPALQDEWALYEIMYALSNNQEAPPEALKRENVQTAHLRLLYHVSRKEFDAAMHVNAGPDSTIYPDFWDTFAAWYCGDDGWKANLMKLNIKFGDDLFRGTMLRLWEGKITLAQAREIMEKLLGEMRRMEEQ